MGIVRLLIRNPAITAVLVALSILLGVMSVQRLPVQLLPSIERPVLGVMVTWRAASPQEMESEIVEPIERELRGITGMTQLASYSNSGSAFVNMEFALGTDMDQTFTEVSSRLQRVRGLPADAERPQIIRDGGGAAGQLLIFLFVQHLPDSTVAPDDLRTLTQQVIAPEFENIDGVGSVNVLQNTGERIIQVEFDPFLTAQLGLTIDEIAANLNRSSDVSGGTMELGRRDFTLRFEGRYAAEKLEDFIIVWRNDTPVRLGDIATVTVGPDRGANIVYQNGLPALGIQVMRQPGGNTLAAINDVIDRLETLNETLPGQYGVRLEKSFDPSVFIRRAISLLTSNMLIGILLAIGALWLFIRKLRATLLIAAAIPICLGATFLTLGMFDRTINVISLAGLAFAVGMVLDAAIVVLEQYVRHVEDGESPMEAAAHAVSRVGGALFASTLTTIVIFVPIVFFEDVEGQLFADLALTIAIAVGFSFLVAIFILPSGAAVFLKGRHARAITGDDAVTTVWDKIAGFLVAITARPFQRAFWIAALTIAPVSLGWFLMPQLNYLPPVKRDAIDAFVSFPSGASTDVIQSEFAEVLVERIDPYMTGEKEPRLKNYYLLTGPWGGQIGIRVEDQSRVEEMTEITNRELLSGFPDTRAFAQQGSLFGGMGNGGGASISLELQSADYDQLSTDAIAVVDLIQSRMPGSRVMPFPDPQIVTPELRLIPNDRRLAEVGMSRDNLSRIVRAFGDGLWLGEYFHQDSRLDILLRSQESRAPEELESLPIVTPSGAILPLGDLASVESGVGPNQIYRRETRRTIALNIVPPPDMALGETVTLLRDLEPEIRGMIPPDASLIYGGDADSLSRAVSNLSGNFILAILLLFMVMAALFRSISDAVIVLICLPMAAIGGILGIQLLNLTTSVPLDLLGMIGFIILLGLVVNNAILLVAETRQCELDGLNRDEAVHSALKSRIRPIFMSTSTSLMGMIPLLVSPGAGSIIYKGLATVIVGGMALSTLFTLVLLPALLRTRLPFKARTPLEITGAPNPQQFG